MIIISHFPKLNTGKKMVEENQLCMFDHSLESTHHDYKLTLDELLNELAKFNLTPNQAKVYIFLGKYGSKTAPEVCKALKIARTETYHILSTLQSRGIVSATFEHPITFSSLPVKKAVSTLVNAEKERVITLENKEKHVQKLWESIPEFIKNESNVEENKFQMLQGSNPINSKLLEMVSNIKDEIMVLGSEKDYLKIYHSKFFSKLIDRKTNCRILSSWSEKTEYIFKEIEKKRIKKIKKNIDNKLFFVVRDRKEIIFFTKNYSHSQEELTAMWTDSKALVYSMNLLFDFIWDTSQRKE